MIEGKGSFMELVETDFLGGVAGAFGLVEAEGRRQLVARAKWRALRDDPNCDEEALGAALEEAEPLPPLWQRIAGFRLRDVGFLAPSSLRAGIRRLLRVVEQMFRAELKTEDVDEDGGPAKLSSGEVSYAGRSGFWDPLDEICSTLGIAPRALSTLCKMRTGLRARELCDAIRAEKLRAELKTRFEGLMAEWRESMDVSEKMAMAENAEDAAWRFLRWMRGGAKGANRKRLAYEFGMTSSERLCRAAFVSGGETLAEMEAAVAKAVIRAMLRGGDGTVKGVGLMKGEAGSHGACFNGVVSPGNPWANGEGLGSRFADEECPPEKE